MTGAPTWAVVPAAAVVLAVAFAGAVLDARSPVPPVAECARLLRQRRRATVARDGLLWRVGTAGPLTAALLMAVVVPAGGTAVADLPVGVVWFNAVDVVLWAVVWLAGWAPNSIHALVGGYRFLAQALSYELPLMFALVAPAVAAGSLRVGDVVEAQAGLWFVVWMPVSCAVFLLSVAGFAMWGPLGQPVGRDVAGGVFAEAAGVDRLLLLAGRYALLAAGSGMAVSLFLGGGAGPVLPGWAWTGVKTLGVLALLVALRGRLPVVHPERLARAGWLVVLPAALAQLLLVAVVVVVREG